RLTSTCRTSPGIASWSSTAPDPTKPRAPGWRFSSSAVGSPASVLSKGGWRGGWPLASRSALWPPLRFPLSRVRGSRPADEKTSDRAPSSLLDNGLDRGRYSRHDGPPGHEEEQSCETDASAGASSWQEQSAARQ